MTERLNRLKLPFTRISAVFGWASQTPFPVLSLVRRVLLVLEARLAIARLFWRHCVHHYCALAMKYCYNILYS